MGSTTDPAEPIYILKRESSPWSRSLFWFLIVGLS